MDYKHMQLKGSLFSVYITILMVQYPFVYKCSCRVSFVSICSMHVFVLLWIII